VWIVEEGVLWCAAGAWGLVFSFSLGMLFFSMAFLLSIS